MFWEIVEWFAMVVGLYFLAIIAVAWIGMIFVAFRD